MNILVLTFLLFLRFRTCRGFVTKFYSKLLGTFYINLSTKLKSPKILIFQQLTDGWIFFFFNIEKTNKYKYIFIFKKILSSLDTDKSADSGQIQRKSYAGGRSIANTVPRKISFFQQN